MCKYDVGLYFLCRYHPSCCSTSDLTLCTGRFAIDEFAQVFDGFSVSSSLFETSSVDNMLVDLINILITLSDRIKRFNSVDTGS